MAQFFSVSKMLIILMVLASFNIFQVGCVLGREPCDRMIEQLVILFIEWMIRGFVNLEPVI